MPVEAACPSCAGKFRLPDAAAGKKIRCPKCKGPLEVPPLEPAGESFAPEPAAAEAPAPEPVVLQSPPPSPTAPVAPEPEKPTPAAPAATVEVACPSCAGKFRLPEAAAGKKIRCPKCKGPLDVPPLEPSGVTSAPEPAAPKASAVPTPAAPAAVAPKPTAPPQEALKNVWRSEPQQPAVETPRAEVARSSAPAETKRAEPKSQPKTAPTKAAPKIEPQPQAKPEPKLEPKPEPKPEPKREAPRPTPPAPLAEPRPEQWFLRGEDGEDFGPVDKPTLDAWHDEGRMTADSQVLKEGTDQWLWASDLYPDLEEPEPEPAPAIAPTAGSSIHRDDAPDVAPTSRSAARSARTEPASDDDIDPATGQRLSPHSKPVAFLLALTLGIFGIHRFYLGYVGIGLAMFFTLGGLMMWSLTDALRILFGHVTDAEGLKLRD